MTAYGHWYFCMCYLVRTFIVSNLIQERAASDEITSLWLSVSFENRTLDITTAEDEKTFLG